ncbi:WxL domain-containing protein [Schleiferilactobacillus perolens]|uniref:WxL domain-containing protein n=1 Tax=Schleiferilactobacillus perolens DSM 12744 TaxID=1423792 RepID=A0A0R1MSF1_9LACO|nr:WxL domain-containing protein [Schleiferilactobacillus perolens]KRL11063.1 hypothetical protein FD09_GL000788 [Schleiferilactobacillus perolens DSM 12744]
MKRMYVTLAATALVGLGALLPATTVYGVTGPGTSTTGPNLSANTTVTDGQTVFVPDGDTPAKAKSTAEFTVQAGELQLVAVPDLNFGQISVGKILSGGKQELDNNGVKTDSTSKNVTAFDGNSAGKLIVNDLRGTGEGWRLSTSLANEFKSLTANAPVLNGIKLNLTATGTNQVSGTVALNGTDIDATGKQVASAASGLGKESTTWNITGSTNASLTLPGQGVDVPNDAVYQADITWTLVAGA